MSKVFPNCKLVVRTGHHYAMLFNQFLNLEVWNKFLNAKLFGNRANRDNATVVIHRYTFYPLKCYEKPF